jgi:hypothetical protein
MLPTKLVPKLKTVPLTTEHFNAYFNSYSNDVPMGLLNKRRALMRDTMRRLQESPTPTHDMYYNNYSMQLQNRNQLAEIGLETGIYHVIDSTRIDRVIVPSSARGIEDLVVETYDVTIDTELPSSRIILNYGSRNIPIPDSYHAVIAVHRKQNGKVHQIRIVNTTFYETIDVLAKQNLNHYTTIYAINEIITDIYRTRVCVNHITIGAVEKNVNIYTLSSPIHGIFKLMVHPMKTAHGTMYKYTIIDPPMWLKLEQISDEKYLSCFDDETLEKYANIKDKKKCVIM